MTRRAYGSGTLVERPKGSGSWTLRIRVGIDPATGKPRRRTFTIKAKTKAAAERQVRVLLAELEEEPQAGSSATVATLLEQWMAHVESRGRSPHTIASNRRIIQRVINPALGDVEVGKLTGRKIDDFYAAQLRLGLSSSTVRRYHAVLSAALNQAVRWDWIPSSPMVKASPPVIQRREVAVPSVAEVSAVLSTLQARDEVVAMAAFIATVTGARRGEICALRWSDLEGSRLRIHASVYAANGSVGIKSTKTGRARSVVVGQQALAALAAWRARGEDLARQAGVEMGPDAFIVSRWPDSSRFLHPDRITEAFGKVTLELRMVHVHFHSLRHFAATELLAAGVSPQDAASVLGHANPTMTLNVYAHATADRLAAAGAVLDRALETPLSPPKLRGA